MEPRQKQAEAKIFIAVPLALMEIIINSLKPELDSGTSSRSRVEIESSKNSLILKITAEDIVALRAAVNSYLYWIQGIIDIGARINQ